MKETALDRSTVSAAWVELAKRAANGLEVVLLWNRSSNRVKVADSDERVCHHLDFEVARADALSAFYHPFAYATSRLQPRPLGGKDDRRAAPGVDRDDRGDAVAGAGRCGGPGPRRCDGVCAPPEPDHGERRGPLRKPGRGAAPRAVGHRPRRRAASGRPRRVNFLGEEGEERIRAAYPGPTWDRLVEIKRRYDPTNVFRLNQNIPPR